jgi:hypothetical protein
MLSTLILAAALATQAPAGSQLAARPARWAPQSGQPAATKALSGGKAVPAFSSFADAVRAARFSLEAKGEGELKLDQEPQWLEGGITGRAVAVRTATINRKSEPFVEFLVEGERYWVGAAFLQQPGPAKPAQQAAAASERERLIVKRNAKKSARVRAGIKREADEARAQAAQQAKAAKEYKENLPYMLENQRQMLNRQSQLEANRIAAERNKILNRAMNGGGLQGVIYPDAQRGGN